MIPDEFSLKGKYAIVTGQHSRWLKPIALPLAEAGATVAIATTDEKEAQDLTAAIQHLGSEALALRTDITNPREVETMVTKVISSWGQVDILVNSTNLFFAKPTFEITLEEWEQVLKLNLTSAFLCCQAVGRHMIKRKRGSIINVSSGSSLRGFVNGAVYCAAQGGIKQLTEALALEWVEEGLRVNAIGIGWFTPGEVSTDTLMRYIPTRRLGDPSELAALVVYLASDASSYMTGQTLPIDGGLLTRT